jgi:hypothetical protein
MFNVWKILLNLNNLGICWKFKNIAEKLVRSTGTCRMKCHYSVEVLQQKMKTKVCLFFIIRCQDS